MILLRSYNPFPPGSFVYEQPLASGSQLFPPDGLSMDQQAKKVLAFRKGNNLPGADFGQVVTDISAYTCNRLGGMSQWCTDSDAPTPVFIGASGGGCATCGKRAG